MCKHVKPVTMDELVEVLDAAAERLSELVDCADDGCKCEGNEADKELFAVINNVLSRVKHKH